MKNLCSVCILLWMLCPRLSFGEDFLGAPVMPGGKLVSHTDTRLEKAYETSYEDAVNFYKAALKGEEDIKFRDRGTQTQIEEYRTRPWHSVTITKGAEGRTDITILKDNWTWILGTLILRFFGVFGVLCVLYVALGISGGIIARAVKAE